MLTGGATIGTVWLQRSNDYVDAQLRLLTPLTRSELELTNTDGGRLIRGNISPTNTVLAHALVAYEQSRAVRDIRDERVWVADSRQTPTLIVDLADGPVEIGGDYLLVGDLRLHTDGATRYAGLDIGGAGNGRCAGGAGFGDHGVADGAGVFTVWETQDGSNVSRASIVPR